MTYLLLDPGVVFKQDLEILQSNFSDLQWKYTLVEEKYTNSLDAQTKLDEKLGEKEKELVSIWRKFERATKQLEDRVSRLQADLEATLSDSEILNEELLGKHQGSFIFPFSGFPMLANYYIVFVEQSRLAKRWRRGQSTPREMFLSWPEKLHMILSRAAGIPAGI